MSEALKVLIIDDNHLFRESLSLLIEKHRFIVVGKIDQIADAWSLIEQQNPNIICLDLVMPEQDTLNFIVQVKKKYPAISTIVCSSLKEEHIVSKALETGCFDYLFKPFEEQRLIQSLEKAGAA
ncbi:MAG: response regulator transcription factor [Bdellovibrionales bacterium]